MREGMALRKRPNVGRTGRRTGHRHDAELGLVNMRGRLYDPMVGRFVSPDPFVTDPFSSQGMNRYSYVQNRPLSFVDPSGFTGQGGPCGGGAKNFVVPNPYPINRGEATFAPTMGSVIPPPPPQFFVFPCADDERRRTGPVGSSSPAGVPEPIAPSPPGAPPTGDPSPPPAPGGNGGASGGPSSGGVAGSAPSGAQGGGAAGPSGSPNGSPGYTQGSMANGSNIPNAPNRPGTSWGPGVNGGVGSIPWIGWEPPPSRSGPLSDGPLTQQPGPGLVLGIQGGGAVGPLMGIGGEAGVGFVLHFAGPGWFSVYTSNGWGSAIVPTAVAASLTGQFGLVSSVDGFFGYGSEVGGGATVYGWPVSFSVNGSTSGPESGFGDFNGTMIGYAPGFGMEGHYFETHTTRRW